MINVCEAILNTPHALIAGTTGSGKSVLLNGVICEGLNRDVEFWFIDLKRVELNQYKKTYNCLRYVTEPEEVMPLLDDIIDDMDDEYERMESLGIKESTRPHRYLVIDELADLVSTKGVLDKLVKLGRLGRAAHIHMIGATQDPSRYTLSAQLMQNITCSVALKCKTSIESKQIVGVAGAEMLPPHGKGLITTYGGVKKVDIPFISEDEINSVLSEHRNSVPATSSCDNNLSEHDIETQYDTIIRSNTASTDDSDRFVDSLNSVENKVNNRLATMTQDDINRIFRGAGRLMLVGCGIWAIANIDLIVNAATYILGVLIMLGWIVRRFK